MPTTITITTTQDELQWQSKRKFESHLDHDAIEEKVYELIDDELERRSRLFDSEGDAIDQAADEIAEAVHDIVTEPEPAT